MFSSFLFWILSGLYFLWVITFYKAIISLSFRVLAWLSIWRHCFVYWLRVFFLSFSILSLPFSIFCPIWKLLKIFNTIWNSLLYYSCFSSLWPFSSYSRRDSQFSFSGHLFDLLPCILLLFHPRIERLFFTQLLLTFWMRLQSHFLCSAGNRFFHL